ncbi:uncharacterized protein ACJ7VT_010828 [Polymixia lowei]
MAVLLKHRVLLALLCSFTFYGLIDVVDANGCPKAQYKLTENGSCKPCTNCNEKSGSEVAEKCSTMSNTKCQCRQGFIQREANSATCKCNAGHILKRTGNLLECHECPHGHFTSKKSTCVKWKECKTSGVKVNGTKNSDAICNEDLDSRTPAATLPKSNKSASSTTHYTTRYMSHNMDHTKGLHQLRTTDHSNVSPSSPKTDNMIMSFVLAFGIVGLLILITVTCKWILIPSIKSYEKPAAKPKDPECRSPVEESGDSSCSSLVKPNPEELSYETGLLTDLSSISLVISE